MPECFTSGHVDGERRFHVPVTVRWRDLDGYGHVNNAAMLTLLEEARIAAFWRDTDADPADTPMAVVDAEVGGASLTFIAGHTIEYLAPIPHYREPIDVQLWVSHLGAASAEVSYEVWGPQPDAPILHTRCRSTIVFVDAETGRPRRVSDTERAAWGAYLGPAVPMRSDRRTAQLAAEADPKAGDA